MRVVMDRTARRLRNAGLAKAFDAWRSTVEGSKIDFHLTKKEELAVSVMMEKCINIVFSYNVILAF